MTSWPVVMASRACFERAQRGYPIVAEPHHRHIDAGFQCDPPVGLPPRIRIRHAARARVAQCGRQRATDRPRRVVRRKPGDRWSLSPGHSSSSCVDLEPDERPRLQRKSVDRVGQHPQAAVECEPSGAVQRSLELGI